MWFRRKREKVQQSAVNRVSGRLKAKLLAAQRKVADSLNRRTAHWTQRQKIIFLAILCGALIAGNLLSLQPGNKRVPATQQASESARQSRKWRMPSLSPGYDGRDSTVFLEVRRRLLRLLETDSGRRSIADYDAARPGYLDSVLYVERLIFPTLPPINIPFPLKSTRDEQ